MAIAFDAGTNGGAATTFSHTVTTAAGRLLLVVTARDGGAGPSGVTYAGVAMTSLLTITLGTFSVTVWYLLGPATGANDVVVSGLSGSTTTCLAASWSGARNSGFPDASATSSGSGTPYTKSLTTIAANAWIAFITVNDINTASAGTGSTTRVNGTGIAVDVFDSGAVSPGSNSMTVTQAGGPNWASAMVSFGPATPSMLAVF